jgi:hypothetical protein
MMNPYKYKYLKGTYYIHNAMIVALCMNKKGKIFPAEMVETVMGLMPIRKIGINQYVDACC